MIGLGFEKKRQAHYTHPPPPRLVPLSPPEHHEDREGKKRPKDPYLMTEEEIKIEGRDFSNPFWYPEHRKILRKSRKEDPGEKEDPEDEAESENQLWWVTTLGIQSNSSTSQH